jgi:hypothetical protein
MTLFTDQYFCHFLQDTAPAPLARTISYNIAGPISALGYQSPTLAQWMSRYATLDPTLIISASDKRKTPSLVAPSAAKKKRTSNRLLIQVRILHSLSIKPFFILIIFYLVQFQTRTQQPLVITESANAPSTGKIFIILFFLIILFIGTYPLLISILFIQRITTNSARKTFSGGNCIITNLLLCCG